MPSNYGRPPAWLLKFTYVHVIVLYANLTVFESPARGTTKNQTQKPTENFENLYFTSPMCHVPMNFIALSGIGASFSLVILVIQFFVIAPGFI